ncbi:bifunctional tRNA (5-methylaminomethyl-2-thiouridine)(34)-methyltransferase MnmD/FAD-dependent 5-carboxymethylaminomethyl-2-thiouridine(34) oxidoreductase MnmC [Methyloversatilis thermotolerans]|uniref:bifunctional tRNA (5-methylaminomethyl-2-thiouridine)(34)-methyltransferase MnmD/FAD-dependent 5-carboxymethylaminomethyl-2-thiouridine(34) oxidoreductase MnmC n=1 Tax=Methyloversatilis thermotolerans TaxID=1346290 RepID=UPI00058BD9A3|nr:bifunctional tRNA (5-methylaminomethyl-2-thiouridine)(34)-methyltransferase MnmD/FAD-dependent 5-carboxymethylaminomethyl-2-thiouridine(34) oxidoreductase MnmC [Methyloversatilis thermotolerans]
MSRPLQPLVPAPLEFADDGTPRSTAYGDVYHSSDGALAQAQHVFLAGNGLPGRWAGRERFVVLETGFGLGLNFLATWRAWRDSNARCDRLHFVSVEKHPFAQYDLSLAYQRLLPAEMSDMAQKLVERWPLPVRGLHRIEFEGGRIILTLALGDAEQMLPQLTARADAIYLDGFSPARNPELWSPTICRQLARLAMPDATLATWSVASAVRDALGRAGFQTDKAAGFGPKRHMLVGQLHPSAAAAAQRHRPVVRPPQRVAVIGAGLAGCALAERLAARGVNCVLIERHARPAQEASGNPAGVLRPMVARDDSVMARFSRAAFLHASAHLRRLDSEGHELKWGPTGVMQIAHDDAHEALQRDVAESRALPGAFVRYLSAWEMSRRIGYEVAQGGWWFPRGAWVNPASLCEAHIRRGGSHIETRMSTTALGLEPRAAGWRIIGRDGFALDTDVVVLANAADASALHSGALPLSRVRGQITRLPRHLLPRLHVTVCREGYICPTADGDVNIGASFDIGDSDATVREDSHAGNLLRLQRLLPDALPSLPSTDRLHGRVAFRTATPDRLPVIGEAADGQALFTGLGARGLVWSPLAAEMLASSLCGEPLPLEGDLVRAVSPARFAGQV